MAEKLKLYKDSNGNLKGDGTVTYEDPSAASAAIEWYNGQPFMGSVLKVEFAGNKTAPPAPSPSRYSNYE